MALSIFSAVRSAHADPVSGAIFTTDVTGTEVNVNQYAAKTDVYLNGGPGPGAPQTAAGLPDGNYFFQVTDPSGKTLLSSDNIVCREVTVSGGNITAIVPATDPTTGLTCTHNAGTPGPGVLGIPVQLFPFDDTPNNGGVYKAWMTNVLNFNEAGCSHLVFGFCPSDSKTDNFKVKMVPIREIDTTFFSAATGAQLDGLFEVWTDTLDASNVKWTYTNPNIGLFNQAHVEAVEVGTHQITVSNQAGCTVVEVDTAFPGQPSAQVLSGPGTVSVTIPKTNNKTPMSWFINVYCA
jgi:hypothetical protein